MGDDWWATETAWFSFHHPGAAARRLALHDGAAEHRHRRGRLPGSGTTPRTCRGTCSYSTNYSALPLPRDQDLDDCRLPTGVAIKVIEPCTRYALGYDDGERLQADLRFEGVMSPEPLTAVGSTFGSAHHFDQFGRVTGEIVLHGERIPIDCIGMRDRTWGRRPEDRPRQAAYVTGAADADARLPRRDEPAPGRRPRGLRLSAARRPDGRASPAASDGSSATRAKGWITRVTLTRARRDGRELIASGVPVSRMIINRHTFIDVNSLVRWDLDGAARVGRGPGHVAGPSLGAGAP